MKTPCFVGRKTLLLLLLGLLWASVLTFAADSDAQAAAPQRTTAWCTQQSASPGGSALLPCTDRPYAEATVCARPEVIFCEDFNYPSHFYWDGLGLQNCCNWFNPGLSTGLFGFVDEKGRRINPATTYPTKPQGAMPSGSQPDNVWVANWNPTLGATGTSVTWGYLRGIGVTVYTNGTPITNDIYIRHQIYWTSNWTWPGDPKTDKYLFGVPGQCYDNKILFIYPPEGVNNPTNAAYDAGPHTQCGSFSEVQQARFADAWTFRYGDSGDNYKVAPLCSACVTSPTFQNYAPYQSLTLRNPGDTPRFGQVFRFDVNRWYTLEFRYKLGSAPGTLDGLVEAWVDGVKVYSFTNIATCGVGDGNCLGVGALVLLSYHNMLDPTVWNGQQVIDNLVISRSYIGPPGGGSTMPPASPTNLRVQ